MVTEMFLRLLVKDGERLINSNIVRSIYYSKNVIYFEYKPKFILFRHTWYAKFETEEEAKHEFDRVATELRYRQTQMK